MALDHHLLYRFAFLSHWPISVSTSLFLHIYFAFFSCLLLLLSNSHSVFGQCQSVGQWGDWAPWQPCPSTPTRSELNVQRRIRQCQALPIGCDQSRSTPFYCPGAYSDLSPCVTTTTTTTAVITTASPQPATTTTAQPSNACAQWTNWMEWSACTDTCGGCGTKQRFRSCNHFVANCPCPGSAFEKVNCNLAVCVYPRQPTCCGNFTPATVNNQFQCA